MRFGILGPLQVGGGEAAITAGRDRAVLAMLLLHPDRVVPSDELVDAMWEGDPPSTARGQLQSAVSRLRRTLVALGCPPDVIVTDPAGYRLRTPPSVELDSLLFDRMIREGRALLAADRLADAAIALRSGLALWRGPALAGITGAPVRRSAASLDEQRMLAMEDSFEVELRLGRARDLVAELADQVERHPLRERLRVQLMLALSDSGRRADALAIFRAGRDILAEELGIEPGPALRATHQRILAGEATSPGVPAARSPVRCLPRPIDDFTGRQDAVAWLTKEIRETGPDFSAVHVIDGMPGSGKTTLAVHVATGLGCNYPDAQLFIDLHGHSVRDPLPAAAALAALLRQLGLSGERIPADLEDRIALWRTELASRRVLLVLDNAASTAQVSPLLPAGPGSLTLVTSRRRLMGLDGVRAHSLGVLEPAEAVELLAKVAGTERVAAEPAAAEEVVRRCGYLPLAIRLAGARLAHRSRWRVADLVERLGADRAILAEFTVEHRTLADAFALSYAQLSGPAKRMFRLLGLHPGEHFDSFAGAAVTDLPLSAAREHLDELVDAHLVDELDAGRHRLHDLVREYATELVAVVDSEAERGRGLRALLDHYLHVAATLSYEIELPTSQGNYTLPPPLRPDLVAAAAAGRGREWLAAQRMNLIASVRRALEEGLHRYAWQLARASWRQLYLAGHLDELIQTHTDGLRAAEALGDDAAIATMHNYLASAYCRLGEFQRAADSLGVVLRLRERLGDLGGMAVAYVNLGPTQMMLGRTGEAVRHLELALKLERQSGNGQAMLNILGNLGTVYLALGRRTDALRMFRNKLFMARGLGELRLIAAAMGDIGAVYSRRGAHDQALRRLNLALRLLRTSGNRFIEGDVLNEIGMAERARGRPDRAAARHREALVAMRDAADRAGECASCNGLGRALLDLGDTAAALETHERALRGATKIQYWYEQARALDGIAACLRPTDPATARSHWTRALALLVQCGSPEQHEVRRRLAELG